MKKLFHNGEAIVETDISDLQDIANRKLFDDLITNLAMSDSAGWSRLFRNFDSFRPLRQAGATSKYNNGDTTITILGGAWLTAPLSSAFGEDSNSSQLVNDRSTNRQLPGFVAASPGQYRRDIIQARIVISNDAPIPVSFEDAATRALSTSVLVKRSRVAIEFTRKAGAEYATQALADTLSNEVSADPGWTKISSVLCDDTGLIDWIDNVWDWRNPWGYSTGFTLAEDWWREGAWTYINGSIGGPPTVATLSAYCPVGKLESGSSSVRHYAACRVENIFLSYDWSSGVRPTIELRSRLLAKTAMDKNLQDVSTALIAGENVVNLIANTKPLWTNGLTHAGVFDYQLSQRMLEMNIGASSTGHVFSSVAWNCYGGF